METDLCFALNDSGTPETRHGCIIDLVGVVAPPAGAWIETPDTSLKRRRAGSPPLGQLCRKA